MCVGLGMDPCEYLGTKSKQFYDKLLACIVYHKEDINRAGVRPPTPPHGPLYWTNVYKTLHRWLKVGVGYTTYRAYVEPTLTLYIYVLYETLYFVNWLYRT